MTADRVAKWLWAGALVFGLFALAAWIRIVSLAPWEALLPSVGGIGGGYAGGGVVELTAAVVLPLVGNLLIVGEARRTRSSRRLRRLHLVAWLASIGAAILLVRTTGLAFLWMLTLALMLIPTQLTLLAATYVVAARARTHAAG